MNQFNAIDLFSGAGGLALGITKAGFNVVIANELEKDFCLTYEKNHPKTKVIREDVGKLDFKLELQNIGFMDKIHLVFGGPPCQGFSTVGKKEESDPRNILFNEFVRVIGDLKPDFVLFENVSGFKKMYSGRMFDKLCSELDKLKYEFKYSLLNARDYGLPQSRNRTIIVAYQNKFKFEMPTSEYAEAPNMFQKKVFRTLKDAISDLPEIGHGEVAEHYATPPQNDFQEEMRNGMKKLTEHIAPNHGESLLNVLKKVPYGGSILDVPMELRPKSYFANTYARLVWEKPAPTMTRNFGTPSSSRCIHPNSDRGLTTREGARLQGFPDSYMFVGSRISKNLQIGNAVPPILGRVLGKCIFNSLQSYYGG